jgi:hypothetical protein
MYFQRLIGTAVGVKSQTVKRTDTSREKPDFSLEIRIPLSSSIYQWLKIITKVVQTLGASARLRTCARARLATVRATTLRLV